MSDGLSALIASEEAKRIRHVSVHDRRRLNELALKRIAGDAKGRRNSKEACLAKQARLLASMKAGDQCQ